MNLTPEQKDRIHERMRAWEKVNGVHPVDSPWFGLNGLCGGVTIDGCCTLEWLRELVRLIDAELAAPSAAEQG